MAKISYAKLTALLGTAPKDAAVTAAMAACGKVTVKSDYIIAKEAGFDFALSAPAGKKGKVLSTLFLYDEGVDKHRGFTDLPKGLAYTTRDALLATMPKPAKSWAIDKQPTWDHWMIDGYEVAAHYRGDDRKIGYYTVSQSEQEAGGISLSTHPLHFETKPADAPDDADLVGMGLLVAWAAGKFELPPKHAGTAPGKQLLQRLITPRAFLVTACNKTLTSLDFVPKLSDFLYGYTHRLFNDDDGHRAKTAKQIQKTLGLPRPDERYYVDDFLGTFAVLKNPFYVPDSWAAVDRIAPILDARWADFSATKFTAAPKVELYDKAVVARDRVTVEPDRKVVAKATADAKLADDLVGVLGKSLKDPAVKAVLARAALPIGKTIDKQANAALGVAYMGSKIEIAGKRELAVTAIYFYATGETAHVRSVGAEVEFVGYPAALPGGPSFGDSRAAVTKKLGKPTGGDDESDRWETQTTVTRATFKRDKLIAFYVGMPRE